VYTDPAELLPDLGGSLLGGPCGGDVMAALSVTVRIYDIDGHGQAA
jgi:hypothetical protein